MSVRLEHAHQCIEGRKILVFINDVEGGLKCNCICPSCGTKLIAKNKVGNKVQPHFQHYDTKECTNAVETALHLLAKEVIEESREIVLPSYKEKYLVKDEKYRGYGPLIDQEKEFLKQKRVKVISVKTEKSIGNITPDLIVDVEGKSVLVEIFVTHKVDQEKLVKIKSKGLDTIEIDLHSEQRSITKDSLKRILLNGSRSKWIYNKSLIELKRQHEIFQKSEIENEKQFRDDDFKRVEKKREQKKRIRQSREVYLAKAHKWIQVKRDMELLKIEKKYGYSIFKKVSENWVLDCPKSPEPKIFQCLKCEYNSHVKPRWKNLDELGEDLLFVKCLYDLFADRYYNHVVRGD
ncbi:MAG: competence protein CoiA family protein [Reichenbachiella sp.]|uniref:competence protein CoiA family protein n=1 Tax=Reichenbachiella sp. TaxID=2184521 RepID=UPI00329A4B3E